MIQFALLAVTLACLGCAGTIGYHVGARRDARDWKAITPPWDAKLNGLKGKGLHLQMNEGESIYCVLDSVWADQQTIAVLPYGQTSGVLPGAAVRSSVVTVSGIKFIEVGPRQREYATKGIAIGLMIDIAVLYLATRGFQMGIN